MLDEEDLDILVTPLIDLDIINQSIKNGIRLILCKKSNIWDEAGKDKNKVKKLVIN